MLVVGLAIVLGILLQRVLRFIDPPRWYEEGEKEVMAQEIELLEAEKYKSVSDV